MHTDNVQEDVPRRFVRRLGDWVQEGSNNTIIILGRDRASDGAADPSAGLGHIHADGGGRGAGTVHLIAGRADAMYGHPDIRRDLSYLYLSMKTEADKNLGTGDAGGDSGADAAAILRSTNVRIAFRKTLKITLDGNDFYVYADADGLSVKSGKVLAEFKKSGDVTINAESVKVNAKNVDIGENPQSTILGENFKAVLELHSNTHVHSGGTIQGMTGSPTTQITVPLSTQVRSA